MNIVNLGCGWKYNREMINLDFIATCPDIIPCDLTGKLPLKDNSIDWIYTSNFLEHITLAEAKKLLSGECKRILKPNGGIRIVVPDLEDICRAYIKQIDLIKEGKGNDSRYKYSVIELLDQLTREDYGGLMQEYWDDEKRDIEYLRERHGVESVGGVQPNISYMKSFKKHPIIFVKRGLRFIIGCIGNIIFGWTKWHKVYKIGAFQMSGEKHKWMYDRYSIVLLLKQCGYTSIKIRKYSESDIPEFKRYGLEENSNGVEYKVHNLYVEARVNNIGAVYC